MAREIIKKYFSYLRKSSEQDDRQALSIPSQRDELIPVRERESLTIIEELEESHSAKRPGRPVFNSMCERIERGEANCILIWNLNRLSRNALDTGRIIDLLDRGLLLEIRTPHQTFKNLPNDKFLLNLLCSQAKLENDTKGEDVKRGLNTKAKLGWRPNGVPVGYRNTPHKEKGFKTIETDPERFHLVRRMWDLMLTGHYSASQIWRLSIEWGLTSVPHKKIGGKSLRKSYVFENIFGNPFYYGWFQYKEKDTGEMVWQKGEHKAMIEEWEYDRVQVLMGRKDAPRPKKLEQRSPFGGGIIHCADCTSSVTFDPKTKRQKNGNVHQYDYLHCTHRKDETCKQNSVTQDELTVQVQSLLGSLTISPRFRSWAIKHLHEIRKTEAQSHETVLRHKHTELEGVVNQLDGLLLKYSSPENVSGGFISNDEYQMMKTQLVKRKSALEEELNDTGKEIEQWVELSERTFNFACYASIWFEKGDYDTKRAILQALGTNLSLKDKKLNVALHPFFNSFIENKKSLELENASVRTSGENKISSQNMAKKGKTPPLGDVCPTWLPR